MKYRANAYSKYLRLASIVPILLSVFLNANRVAFLHTHITVYGETWTHAHPYNKNCDNTPIKQHHHSAFDFQVIQQLQNPIPLACALTLPIANIEPILQYIHIETKPAQKTPCYRIIGRAPPSI